jgi:hypothetical protein
VTDKRRDQRFPARIIARIKRRNELVELLTNDVSFRGVFIRTDAPPSLRQLVRVELVLPDKVVVAGHAMVVHVSEREAGAAKGEGVIPGIGLQFWGPIEHGREWEQFIHGLKRREKAGTPAAKATDKIRRASERFKLAMEVILDGKMTMTRDISENGMAIRTEVPMPIGTRADLQIRHEGRTLKLDVVVRRTIDEPDFRGLGVEIMGMTPQIRSELVDFIRSSTPRDEEDEDLVLVPPGDPKLH